MKGGGVGVVAGVNICFAEINVELDSVVESDWY